MARKQRPRRLDRGPKKIKNPPPPPEVLEKRAALVQATGGGDPVRASSGPLGYACEWKLIRGDDYYAAVKYAGLHRRVQDRSTRPGIISLDGRINGPPPANEEAEARDEAAYLEANRALEGAGPRAYRAVKNIAVFEHWPAFLAGNMTRHQMDSGKVRPWELAAIHDGLDVLARHFGIVAPPGNGPHRRQHEYERTG